MRTLTLRGVPDDTLERLRARAAANHRSLNGELLAILDAATAKTPELSALPSVVREPAPPSYAATAARHPAPNLPVDQEALAAVCRVHRITWLAAFGSYARGEAGPDSDVDLVVDFEPGHTPGFGIVRVAESLRPVFQGRRVDLVTRRGLAPGLREQILNSAMTLYAP